MSRTLCDMNMKTSLTSTQKVEIPNISQIFGQLIAKAPVNKSTGTLQQGRAPSIRRSQHQPVFLGQNHLGRGCPDD